MIKKEISKLRKSFKKFDIDGYIVPKNDEFFSEYSKKDRLKIISDFTGSAGYAIILKNKNFLFVDGRYTIQAEKESGKNFKIVDYTKINNCKLFKGLTIGITPEFFTNDQVQSFFLKNNKIKEIRSDLIESIFKRKLEKSQPFFSLKSSVVGESHTKKIKKVVNWLKKNKSNYLFITDPENVAWLLNIRGDDNPFSPIPNCRLLIDNKKKNLFNNKN